MYCKITADCFRQSITDPAVQFRVGLAQSLALAANQFDAVVSGLVLNFVPEPETAVVEMMKVTKPGGTLGIFLWDYADGVDTMKFLENV